MEASKDIEKKSQDLLISGKIKRDMETEKRIYFTVEGESEKHSVIYEKIKKEWKCDCKFNSLHHKKCSHIFASILKEGV